MFRALLAIVTLLFCTSSALAMAAKDGCGSQECSKCHTLTVKDASELLSFSGVTVKSVKPAPSHGLHEVLFEKDGGVGVVFIDYGKKHLVQGMLIDLKTLQPVSSHEKDMPQPKQFSGVDPKLIPVQHAVVMGNPKAVKKIYVFTDPDCPYCRQLHPVLQQLEKQMPELSINIMLYPLIQLHPESYDKSRAVLAKRSRDLLDKAFSGKVLPKPKGNEGKAAVDAIIAFAQQQGISGTPMILLPDGTLYQGPRDVDSIRKAVEGK